MTDELLWNDLRGGSRQAFEKIYHQQISYLFNYGRKVFDDTVTTEDCIHDLFVEVWQKHSSIGPTDNIRAYLTSSLRRKMIRVIKKNKRAELKESWDGVPFEAELSIEEIITRTEHNSERAQQLKSAFTTLSARQKEVLYLRYYQDMSYEEIAEALGIKYQSLRNIISGGVKRLRTEMTKVAILLIGLIQVEWGTS